MTTVTLRNCEDSQSEQAASIEQRLRANLNQWARGQRWLSNKFGSQIEIDRLETGSAYVLRCLSQYERRTVTSESSPYPGGQIDNRGMPPEPWSLPAKVPANFAAAKLRLVLPHTDSVAICDGCSGHGTVICGTCLGTTLFTCRGCGGGGSVACFNCGGGGRKQETRYGTIQINLPNGGYTSQPVTETVTVTCPICGGTGRRQCLGCGGTGRVRCTNCRDGRVVCSSCQGCKQLLWQKIVTIEFKPAVRTEVLNSLTVPSSEVQQAQGTSELDVSAPELRLSPSETPAHLREPVDRLSTELAGARPKNARLHYERLSAERVDVAEVQYTLKNSGPRTLWVMGEDQRVFAPNAPADAGKIFLARTAALAALCLVLALAYSAWLAIRPAPPAVNRALAIRGVATHLPATPPVSYKIWVQDVAYTLRVKQMPKGPEYFKNDIDWLTTVAADNDMNAVSRWDVSLGLYETETAKEKIKPFYRDLFTYIQAHDYSLATSQSSPYMAVAWAKMRSSKALSYVYGINQFLFHKPTDYQPWKADLWIGYLQRP